MAKGKQAGEPAQQSRELIGGIWADWRAGTVEVEFSEGFLKRPLDEQAAAASALIEAAVNEHIDAQEARLDALTAAGESGPAA